MNWSLVITLVVSAISAALGYLYSHFRQRKFNAEQSSKTDLFNAQLTSYRARISQLESELENEKYNHNDVSALEAKIKAGASRINELETQLNAQKHIESPQKTLENIELYKQQILELERDIKGSAVKMLRLEGQLEVRKNELENDENVALRNENKKLEEQLAAKSTEISYLESELDLYVANYTELNSQKDSVNKATEAYKKKYNALKEQLNAQIEAYNELGHIAKENDEQLENYTLEISKLEENLTLTQDRIATLEHELNVTTEYNTSLETQLGNKKDIAEQLSESTTTITQLETELNKIKVAYNDLSDVTKINDEQLEQLENDLTLALDNASNLEQQLKDQEHVVKQLTENQSKAIELEAELKSSRIELKKINEIVNANNEELELYNVETQQLKEELTIAKDKITVLEGALHNKKETDIELEKSHTKIAALQEQLTTITSEYETFNATSEANTEALTRYKTQLNHAQNDLKIAQEKTVQLEKELKAKAKINDEFAKSNKKIEQLEAALKTYKLQEEENARASELSNEQLKNYTSKITQLEDHLKTAQEKVAALENKLKEDNQHTKAITKNPSKPKKIESSDTLTNSTRTRQDQIKNYNSKFTQIEPHFIPDMSFSTALDPDTKKQSAVPTKEEEELESTKNEPATLFDLFEPTDVNAITFDSDVAKAIFGKKIKENDLKLVEGIGPKIEKLFHTNGIKTWKALSECSVKKCKNILSQGGKNYQMYIPDTWPKQARLAYEGKWQELYNWQEELDGGLF